MHDYSRRAAVSAVYAKHLRAFVFATALAVLPFALSIGVSASSSTVTVTKALERHVQSDDVCTRLNQHSGCYVETKMTQTKANNSPLIDVFVRPVSAWDQCTGVITYYQTYYSWTGWALASSTIRFAFCWDYSGAQVTWGPFCHVSTIIGYGGGINYCAAPGYPANPGWAADSWYLYTYATPWWHINNYQQVNIYRGYTTYWSCTYC